MVMQIPNLVGSGTYYNDIDNNGVLMLRMQVSIT
jgi:hypothetical protein